MTKILLLLLAVTSLSTSVFAEEEIQGKMKTEEVTPAPAEEPAEEKESRNEVTKPSQTRSLVIKAGVNLSNWASDYMDDAMESSGLEPATKGGIRLGLEGRRHISGLVVGAQMLYSSKGAKYTGEIEGQTAEIIANVNYLDLAFELGFEIPMKSLSIIPKIKPYYGAFLTGDVIATVDGEEVSNNDVKDGSSEIGIGVEVDFLIANKLVLEAGYDFGLNDISVNGSDAYNRALHVSVGYNINLTR